ELGKDLRMRNGKLRLPFTGNRIDLLPAVPKPGTVASADVLIDGKKPSEFPELYAIARPSATQLGFWPGIKRVSHQKPLALETWRARITEVNDAADQFKFSVTGSVTGADGAGTSGQRFVSNSGRVVIEPEDWHLKSAREFGKKNVPEGFEVTWTVIPQFVDVYQAPKEVDATRDNAVTLAQGLPNGPHTLELSTPDGKPLAIRAIRVYEPPFKLAPVPGK
ncbi:MAG TPA: SGNH/GDSL hydrolase family protein, partial [Armatimonadota bacterium]|nr:SGNH/GDSL hydrolase family protein [Armatimonadota bacterium]